MENVKYTALNYEGYEKYLDQDIYICEKIFINESRGFYVKQRLNYRFKFENNYGASVAKGNNSYGIEKDLFELAVLYKGEVTYDTEITDYVIGHLTNEEVLELLERIKNL